MKKIAFVFALVALATMNINTLKAQNIRLGLKASPNLSWFKPETQNYNSDGVRLGFSYGAVAEFALAEQYSFATGINIIYFGGKLEYPTFDASVSSSIVEVTRTYKMQNLEVPLTVKMKTREIGYNTYFAVFGFGSSVRLKAEAEDKFSNLTRTDIDISGETPLMRVSMILGLGVEHSLGANTSLVGGLTFNNGFTNIMKGNTPAPDNERKQSARSNFLELTVGVLF